MYRFILAYLLVALLLSCTNQKGNHIESQKPKPLKIEQLINGFRTSHPNMYDNDILREEANNEFQKLFIDSLISDNLFEGFPLELHAMKKNNGRNMVAFRSYYRPENYYFLYNIREIYVDIIGAISDSIVSCLREGEFYTISGHYIKRYMDPDEYCRVLGKRVIPYDNHIVIALGDEISLGMYQFEIEDVKSFEGREIIKEDKDMKK